MVSGDPGVPRGSRAAEPPRDAAIVLSDASKRFGNVVALEHLSLMVPVGSLLGVIGPSGSGKTTTIRLMTGGLAPTSGSVQVMGENPRRFRRQTRERIGYMPQLFVLYPDLTAKENVGFVASLFGMLWRRRGRRVREVLELVDLWEARDRRASQLSGGMQRRLELACALVHDPALLFLDEPTAGIDPLLRLAIWQELHRLRDDGRTLIVTTQHVSEAEECDQVALIADGRLIAMAPPDELRKLALGGEVVAIETTRTFDAGNLEPLPMIRAIRQQGPREIWVIAEDAGEALPALVDAVGRAGGEVVSARESRPSFDEVFAELVNRGLDGNRDADRAGAGSPRGGRDGAA